MNSVLLSFSFNKGGDQVTERLGNLPNAGFYTAGKWSNPASLVAGRLVEASHSINGTECIPPLLSNGLNRNEKTTFIVFSPKMLGFI